MKKLIAVFAVFFSIGYAVAQVGPCQIITIVQPDGRIVNCTVCGSVINCM
jgi:hypothetical protein